MSAAGGAARQPSSRKSETSCVAVSSKRRWRFGRCAETRPRRDSRRVIRTSCCRGCEWSALCAAPWLVTAVHGAFSTLVLSRRRGGAICSGASCNKTTARGDYSATRFSTMTSPIASAVTRLPRGLGDAGVRIERSASVKRAEELAPDFQLRSDGSDATSVATTQRPHACVGEVAHLTAVDVTSHGAFAQGPQVTNCGA